MAEDVLARLRRADPCPQRPSYDEATLTTRISAITSATDAETETPVKVVADGRRAPAGRRVHRLLLVAGAVLLVIAIGAITYARRGGPNHHPPATVSPAEPSPTPDTAWKTFTDNAVTFRYPPAWRSYPYQWHSSFEDSLTYLSSTPIPNPCRTTHPGGNIEISCGLPATQLSGDRVLIIWTQSGFPHPAGGPGPLTNAPGTPTRLGGHAARLHSGRAGLECGHIAARTSIQAAIEMGPPYGDDTLQMTACLGPSDQAANTRAVMAMLATLHIKR